MDAVYNDKDECMPVNVPSAGTAPGFDRTTVIETIGRCNAAGIEPLPTPPLPARVRGLVDALAGYQHAAADAAWSGTWRDGVAALAAHPLVRSLDLADALYRELAHAHRAHLPDRLVPS
jgi:6-phospho-beta-glucosidase